MQLDRLLAFLDQDPKNLSLLSEAANAAYEAGQFQQAADLLDRHESLAPLPPALANLGGLALMRLGRLEGAEVRFRSALIGEPEAAQTRFNLAWTLALQGAWDQVIDLVDDDVVSFAPRAAALKVQALHHLHGPEDALACGLGLAERLPDDPDLMGALAVAAMDAEDTELARRFAERATGTPEGLATLGLLDLGDDDTLAAERRFDEALAVRADNGRALLGKGLARLVQDAPRDAAAYLDRSSAVFADHLGSRIAAGWAWFAAGDVLQARHRFEAALAMDDTFAESHGALAVLDVIDGDLESARRRSEVALRLDRGSLSGTLAKTLLLRQDGDPQTADRIQEVALNAPVGPGGRTLAQALSVYAGRRAR